MEILAGARDESHLHDLRGLLARATLLSTEPVDYEDAAASYRGCRRHGETVRRLIDCLIAATAIVMGSQFFTPMLTSTSSVATQLSVSTSLDLTTSPAQNAPTEQRVLRPTGCARAAPRRGWTGQS